MTRKHTFDESDRKGREQGVSRRETLRKGSAALAGTVGLVGLSTPVAAEKAAVVDIFETQGKTLSSIWVAAKAGLGRQFADEDKRSAKQAATETTDVFNQHSDVLVSYANDRIKADRTKKTFNVIRIKFRKDVTVERWIVAEVDGDNNFASAKMVDERPDREIDHWVVLEDLAAAEAPDVLETFVEDYAKPNEPLDGEKKGYYAGRYKPDVSTSLM